MPKRSSKNGTDAKRKGGGIVSAMTQDIELTVEQAEEAAKKAAHAAAVALKIATGGNPPAMPTAPKKGSVTAQQFAQSRSSRRKPKT